MKCKSIHVSQDELKSIIDYDQKTGTFTWKVKASRNTRSGEIAGYHPQHRYGAIRINRRLYPAHRLAWFYVHGAWPDEQVDHINKDKTDNRIANLRLATHSQNVTNQGMRKNNTSGCKGVQRNQKSGKWRARIMSGRRVFNLGSFESREEAHRAYRSAAERLHGDYAGSAR